MPSSSVYGLRIQSNRPIPHLPQSALAPAGETHLSICFGSDFPAAALDGAAHWYASESLDQCGEPTLLIMKSSDGVWFHLRYADGTEFVVDHLGTRIWAAWPEPLTIEDTATYLLGPVMGFVLLLRGTHCLHASAVDVGGRAIALVGAPGAGKSTTAAAFAKLGHCVLSDDVTTLASFCGTTARVQPAYPCVRLWPESAEALFGSADALPLLTPNWDKRYLHLDGKLHRFQPSALPLAAIYILASSSSGPRAPRVETVGRQSALIELVGNAYVPHLKDKEARAAEFDLLSRVVSTVPVRRVTWCRDLSQVESLCQAILDDFRALPKVPATP